MIVTSEMAEIIAAVSDVIYSGSLFYRRKFLSISYDIKTLRYATKNVFADTIYMKQNKKADVFEGKVP